MEISDYLRILRKRGWIIIAVALVAAGSAYAFSKMQTPILQRHGTTQRQSGPAGLGVKQHH